MSKAKGNTLVQILAEELKEWPSVDGVIPTYIVQEGDGEIFSTAKVAPYFGGDTAWYRSEGDNSDCGYWGAFATIASDYKTAIVTRAQWEAERAKLSKPKANAQGWIRNRGRSGVCPVEPSQTIEVRDRDGFVYEVEASALRWDHIGGGGDIMAWRSIGAEQSSEEKASDMCVDKCASTEPGHAEMPAAKYFDGPLQWRDRITEIDAEEARLKAEHRNAIEALEEERVSLVQRLADEGLQLISSNCKHAATQLEEWQRLAMINGQKVAAVKAHREKYSSGLKEAVDAVNEFRDERGFVAV